MSTRVTLAKDAEQHLYRELTDDSLHLEIHFWDKLTLNIPLSEKILQAIRATSLKIPDPKWYDPSANSSAEAAKEEK